MAGPCRPERDDPFNDGVRPLNPFTLFGADGDGKFQVLREDGERAFCRGIIHAGSDRLAVLAVLPAPDRPAPTTLDRLAHEYGLKDELDRAWAVRPFELIPKAVGPYWCIVVASRSVGCLAHRSTCRSWLSICLISSSWKSHQNDTL
jgi:hypothetical protein